MVKDSQFFKVGKFSSEEKVALHQKACTDLP